MSASASGRGGAYASPSNRTPAALAGSPAVARGRSGSMAVATEAAARVADMWVRNTRRANSSFIAPSTP